MSSITTHPESRVGQMVIYKLSEHDVKTIVASRLSAGRGTFTGNDPREGDEYPALIIRDFAQYDTALRESYEQGKITDGAGTVRSWADYVSQASCNLQVFLDGTDTFWATSRSEFDPAKHKRVPTPVEIEMANRHADAAGEERPGEFYLPIAEGHFFTV